MCHTVTAHLKEMEACETGVATETWEIKCIQSKQIKLGEILLPFSSVASVSVSYIEM
jgi:hypothetical protein